MSDTKPVPDLLKQIPYLEEIPLIGILRGHDSTVALTAARVVADQGIRVIEVTLGHADALDTISGLADIDGVVAGVGTVTKQSQVAEAAAVGAKFVVTPVFDSEVIEASLHQGLAIVCGAATPTEIQGALNAGATAAKVFPAAQLGGPDYLRAVLAPLHGAPLVPTGGVTPSNSSDYLESGAIALGAGGSLFPSPILRASDWRALDELARDWVASLS